MHEVCPNPFKRLSAFISRLDPSNPKKSSYKNVDGLLVETMWFDIFHPHAHTFIYCMAEAHIL